MFYYKHFFFSLNTLIVSENNLSKVFFDSDGESTTDLFKSLKALSINGNKISGVSILFDNIQSIMVMKDLGQITLL